MRRVELVFCSEIISLHLIMDINYSEVPAAHKFPSVHMKVSATVCLAIES